MNLSSGKVGLGCIVPVLRSRVVAVARNHVLNLSSDDAHAANRLDLLLGSLGKELGLDDDWLLGHNTLAEHLEHTSAHAVNDRDGIALLGISVLFAELIRHEGPDLVHVDGGAVVLLHCLVEVTHTNLTEVTRVVLVKVNAVVVLSTGVTTSTWVASVLANTTVACGNVSTLFAVLLKSGGL